VRRRGAEPEVAGAFFYFFCFQKWASPPVLHQEVIVRSIIIILNLTGIQTGGDGHLN
jgi:hypothetical protein